MKLLLSLLVLLFVLFPFGQLTRLPILFNPTINIYAHDIVIILLICVWLIELVRNKNHRNFPSVFKYLGLFIIVAFISLTINSIRYPLNEIAIGSLYLVRWVSYAMLFPIVYTMTQSDKKYTNIIFLVMLTAGIVASIFGLAQYVLYPNLRNLMYLGWDPHEFRVFGSYFDSGFAGIIFVLTMILAAFVMYYRKSTSTSMKKFLYVSWGIAYLALALSYSRSSYLAFISSFSALSLIVKSARPAVISIFLIVPLIFILPKPTPTAEGADLTRTTSAYARLSNFEKGIEIIKDHPITGIGFNMMRFENRNRSYVPDYEWKENNAGAGLDSSFMFILATTGILGLIVYILLWIKLLHVSSAFQSLIIPSVTAVFVHSMFNNTLFYPWVMIWLWVLLGVAHSSRDS